MEDLEDLAALLKARNQIDARIGGIIGRPASPGHIGEFIAAHIFRIELEPSATNAGHDGRFTEGPLAGATVNIKLYGKREGLLDISVSHPDYYLALTGPAISATTSRRTLRPCVIDSVFLFKAADLISLLQQTRVKIGTATSVRRAHWRTAELYPTNNCSLMTLEPAQRQQLDLFNSS